MRILLVVLLLLTGMGFGQVKSIQKAPDAPIVGNGTTNINLAAVVPSIPGQHGINLAWSDCSGCSTKIYRGTTPGGENYSAALATVPAGTLVFLDTTGAGGTTYYYTATAVQNNIESAPSNEANAVFPTVPPSPSGLTATVQ